MRSTTNNFLIRALIILSHSSNIDALSMSSSSPSSPLKSIASSRVYISGLRTPCNEEDLKLEFSQYGSVESVEIVYQEQKKSSKRKKRDPFAFVTFESEEIAKLVVSKHTESESKPESASLAKTKTKAKADEPNNKGSDTDRDGNSESPLYSIVKHANPKVPRYAKRIRKSLSEQEEILQICQQKENHPTLLLQVHSSHLHRMLQYVKNLENESSKHVYPIPKIVGSSLSKARNISFVFLHLPDDNDNDNDNDKEQIAARSYWYYQFVDHPVLTRFGIRKLYAVDQMVEVPASKQDEIGEERATLLVDRIMERLDKELDILKSPSKKQSTCILPEGNIILKVQAFPPKQNNLQGQIVAALDRRIGDIEKNANTNANAKYKDRKLSMSSTDFTHTFSCVQVFNPRNHAMRSSDKCTIDEIFMIGISPLNLLEKPNSIDNSARTRNADHNNTVGDEDDEKEICRAYFKLKEAMSNYRRDENEVRTDFSGINAFDCGSSPGGWTKYLLQDEKCKTCFSCDPGALDDAVKDMPGARHMRMRGSDAIETLRSEGEKVNLWVSDMCLADPKQQVDHLLLAKDKGILNEGAFFVLTLKFNTGHSKDTFDLFARQEVERLQAQAKVEHVQLYHLFSNRKGERTIMGTLV